MQELNATFAYPPMAIYEACTYCIYKLSHIVAIYDMRVTLLTVCVLYVLLTASGMLLSLNGILLTASGMPLPMNVIKLATLICFWP
jgi:hypothetical protein